MVIEIKCIWTNSWEEWNRFWEGEKRLKVPKQGPRSASSIQRAWPSIRPSIWLSIIHRTKKHNIQMASGRFSVIQVILIFECLIGNNWTNLVWRCFTSHLKGFFSSGELKKHPDATSRCKHNFKKKPMEVLKQGSFIQIINRDILVPFPYQVDKDAVSD